MFDICCVGHITSDKVVTPNSIKHMAGGTAWYFSQALGRLESNFMLITSIADAERHYIDELRAKNIKVQVQHSASTVFFENIYGDDPDKRIQNVLAEADPFTMQYLEQTDARIFHLGPLMAGDISLSVIKKLAKKSRVSLDVQGYLRMLHGKTVLASDWAEKEEALQHVSILKADVAELKALTGDADVEAGVKRLALWGVKEIVITDGSKGSLIFDGLAFYQIPAYAPQNQTDATGCGDTYMAGYLYKRIKGTGINEAGNFAAAMASLKIENYGPFSLNLSNITERISSGY